MKRIMSFDGGGIRGVFSLQVARRIEQLFREHYGRNDLVLADVVDLFAGTSTGAIIATFLAWGYPVDEIEHLYISHAREMFTKSWFWRRYKSKYQALRIETFFKERFCEDDGTPALLGTSKLRTLLLVVMANASTGSPWPVSNNPEAKYNSRSHPACNLDVPLWQLLRASTAAPTYFEPESIALGGRANLFVDGGATAFNNPALIAVMTATLPCYQLNWPTGRDKLHLVSIGTGGQRKHFTKNLAKQINLLNSLDFFVNGILNVVSVNQDMLCRVLGHCLHGATIDSEIEGLDQPSLLSSEEQKFSYARYNCKMDTEEAGVPLTEKELQMDNLSSIERLQQIGRDYAAQSVSAHDLLLPPAI